MARQRKAAPAGGLTKHTNKQRNKYNTLSRCCSCGFVLLKHEHGHCFACKGLEVAK